MREKLLHINLFSCFIFYVMLEIFGAISRKFEKRRVEARLVSMPNLKFLASIVPGLEGPKIPKVGHGTPHDPFWPEFADFGYFFPFSICLSNLTPIASSMTDIWLLYDFADLAVKCLFGPILGSFFFLEGGNFDPLKLWKYCFAPKVRTSRGDTRLRYCALKSVQRSHL